MTPLPGQAGSLQCLVPCNVCFVQARFKWPGNRAQASSLEKPFSCQMGFTVVKLPLNVQLKFPFARFHLIAAVILLLCTPNNPSVSFPFTRLFACECCPALSGIMGPQNVCCSLLKLSTLPPSTFVPPLRVLPTVFQLCCFVRAWNSTLYFTWHDAPKGVLPLLCDKCVYGHSLKLHHFSLLPSHTKKVEAWCTVYRGSHSVKGEKRVTHLAAAIRHVHLAIFLFKSLL